MTDTTFQKKSAVPLDVLLVAGSQTDVELCLRELKKAGFDPRWEVVQTAHEFCARITAKPYHVVISDYALPSWNGMEALELLQQMEKEIPFILVTGAVKEEAALECLHKGAADLVPKEQLARLPLAVRRALERKFLRDERARAEARAKEFERRYLRLAELSPDPLFILAGDKLAFVNGPGAKLLGADRPEQLLERPALAIVHPDSRAMVQDRAHKLAGGQEADYFDAKLAALDGKPVDVRIAAASLTYNGQTAVQLVARDVTERKRVEEAIKSLAAFPQLNPNPVLEFSRDGRLAYFNDAAMEMARSLGKDNPAAVLPPDVVPIVQSCLTTGQKKLRVETSLGGRTFSWSFFPIKPNQVVHCYVNDTTERQQLESQLRHSQKLESVGRLAAGVAHDFNNILTVIQGHTGLLRSDPGLNSAMSESVQQVSRAAERAVKLTSQLLMFSRKTVIQPRPVDLNDVLTNLSLMLHRTLGEDITFQFSYAPSLPPVYADVGMLEQVIMNLAVNARDAMPRGGQLVISTAVVRLDGAYVERHPDARPGQFVCLSVIDTGCGMDNVTLGRIFEPFFTTKEFGKGTGLGLATVYGIIKRHQGWLEVHSQVGQGSTFKIFLPPGDQVAEKWTEAPAPGEPRGGSETILIVEDESPVRWTVRNVLERYGYRVLEAAAGVEALAVWHQHHGDIALLLTDMVMPVGLSGQELAEKFKSQKPNLKVIYTSGYSVETAGKGLTTMEGVSFLQKPYDADKLAAVVRQCLDA